MAAPTCVDAAKAAFASAIGACPDGAEAATLPLIVEIQRAVCAHFGATAADMRSGCRHTGAVRARQVAMFLSRALTSRSYSEIGRMFGDCDHTTVLYAVRKITALWDRDEEMPGEVQNCARMTGRIVAKRMAAAPAALGSAAA